MALRHRACRFRSGRLRLSTSQPAGRAAVLISGGGSNLQSLIDHSTSGDLPLDIRIVISNRPGVRGLERAQSADISTLVIEHGAFDSREDFDNALAVCINRHKVDVIILAGFMRILTADFVQRFAGRILNIHPSLLPAYPGLHTHRRVLQAGDPVHGCTVHVVTAELDAGPAIIQGRVPVLADDDEETLAARVLAVEHQVYPIAAGLVASGRVVVDGETVTLDGEVLRTPILFEDGVTNPAI